MKSFFSSIAFILTITAFYPYISAILRRQIQPHVFSWLIWAIATLTVFVAQLQSGGGAGAWPIGLSGSITLLVAVLAFFKRGEVSITKADWTFFILALAALPLWYVTHNPKWSVILLTLVDLCGFGPTLRKVYYFPHSESAQFFTIILLRNILAILALEHYTLTTWFFPAVTGMAGAGVLIVLLMRKKLLMPDSKTTSYNF